MTTVSPTDYQRWSDEVARDPGAPSFIRLAEVYMRQGRHDAALRVCLRGLAHHPLHVDAHALLGRLHLAAGQRERAADEWATVARLDPDNFEAHRGLGFSALQQGDLDDAEQHLLRALSLRPGDRTVAGAVALLRERQGGEAAAAGRDVEPAGPAPALEAATSPAPVSAFPPERAVPLGPAAEAAAPPGPEGASAAARASSLDPTRLFEALSRERPFRGAVMIDADGLVVAGRLDDGDGAAEALGAVLGPALDEAARAAAHLRMGRWERLVMEAEGAVLDATVIDDGHVLVVAVAPDAPAGWVGRTAQRAAEIGRRFLEGDA